MKNLVVIVAILAFVSCKNDANKNTSEETLTTEEQVAQQNDGLMRMAGEFVYYADAAVLDLQGNMYGVIINDKMHELNRMAQAYKDAPTDYVKVEFRGKLLEKPSDEEGWPYRVDIIEIISVQKSEKDKNETITLGEDN